jgi:hypothetical protein
MSDALLWVQTIILFLTGVIVAWYTWETHKIRKDAANQNKLIARQVELMYESLQFEFNREHQASEPFFKWTSGSSMFRQGINRFDKTCEFQNEGGAITSLEVPQISGIEATISPKDHLAEGRPGRVEFFRTGTSSMPDVTFEIHYTTRLKKRLKKSFVLLTSKGLPDEIKTG